MQKNSPELWLRYFPNIREYGHKYDRGHAVIIGGNIYHGSTGAAKLAAISALRSGAGLVSIACDAETSSIYAASMNSVMVKIIKNNEDLDNFDSILIGPGNGINKNTKEKALYTLSLKKNIVLDADALTVFQDNPKELFEVINSNVVLTPHSEEFKRIFSFNGDRISSSIEAARLSGAVVLLKGHDSIITSPDGRCVVNEDAPAYLATAGSGDVLSGLIAGFMAQGVDGFTATCISCYIHSEAAKLFGAGLISEDLLSYIPKVIQAILHQDIHH
jgi:ADP-dependent NAD(P)H-hydrate dehydratase / NAD(P)H-hydrate epimerase